ncbi:hypothetical protein B0H19DRAFT_1382587 [Mycena capillaripes]|nr:hypothetical protein B0H19DRAFT_1382587 [Mycena capillaripes]
MLSTKFVCFALALGVMAAPITLDSLNGTDNLRPVWVGKRDLDARSVNSLNGGTPRPVWVERDVDHANDGWAIPREEERSVNSLNGGNPRPVWVERDVQEERSVNSLNGGNVRRIWVERDVQEEERSVNSLNGGRERPVWVE